MTELSVSPGLDPFGQAYYPGLVEVRCGDKQGVFVGGHWNRKRKQQTDVYVSCCCGCGQRLLCREFESHAGRQASKSWSTSIKIADKTSANLGDWIKKQCHKLGDTIVRQKILIWLPAKRQKKLAQIQSYNSIDREHLLVYEDGSEEILYLAVESYTLEGRPSGFADEPSRGKHRLDGNLNDNASSMSTSKRQRLLGVRKSNDTQSMHGAASTLVGLAQTLPKDEEHASGQCARRSGSLDGGSSAVAVEQLQQHDHLPFCWKTLFACQMSLPPSRMHEQIRSVLLDLTSVDNRCACGLGHTYNCLCSNAFACTFKHV
ncbi:TPA: hypothetical protein ACH3X1_010691 [Trebouxia sp. C0004]